MKAFTYDADGNGKGKECPIPASLAAPAEKAHDALVEMVAESNDALMEEYLDKLSLSPEQILEGLRLGVRDRKAFPGALRRRSPQHRLRPHPGFHLRQLLRSRRSPRHRRQDRAIRKSPGPSPIPSLSPPSSSNRRRPFAGRLSYLKIYSGVLKNDAGLQNVRSGSSERLAHIGCLLGKIHSARHRAARRRHWRGGQAQGNSHRDTLCDKGSLIAIRPSCSPSLPSPTP